METEEHVSDAELDRIFNVFTGKVARETQFAMVSLRKTIHIQNKLQQQADQHLIELQQIIEVSVVHLEEPHGEQQPDT